MSELSNGQSWVILLCLPAVVWLFNQTWVRRPLRTATRPLLDRLSARLSSVTEPDPETVELWTCVRRQRLEADLARIHRLIADDAGMSATRQLGNRLAYAQLVDELARTPVSEVVLNPWTTPAGTPPTPGFDDAPSSPASNVEVLELGRRLRRRSSAWGAAGHRYGG